jgi:hypothetical protein
MQKLKNKTLAIMFALILLSSTAIALVSLPTANAHTPPWQIQTTAYLSAEPNPVGIGQQMEIVMALNWVWPGALIQNDIRPHNYTLVITKPNGATETSSYDPYDSGSSRYILYTPDQVGNYTLKFVYPGEVYHYPNYTTTHAGVPVSSYYANDAYENDTFLGATAFAQFTVQQDPVAKLPSTPLPTEYWTRPVFGENSAWQPILSNWVGGAQVQDRWQKDGAAPTSAHIVWTQPARMGGILIGTSDPSGQAYLGFSYEDAFGSPLIIDGIFFYKQPMNHAGTAGDFKAIDLRTGQTLWTNSALNGISATQPLKGQLLDFQQADQHGITGGLLWQVIGSTWVGYDVFTGNWVCNLTGVPSGTEVYTNTGDILRYVLNYNSATGVGWMALWNDTQAMTNAPASAAAYGIGQEIRITGQVIDASQSTGSQNAYTWNVTLPTTLPKGTNSIVGIIPGDMILGTNSSSQIALSAIPIVPTNPWTMWAISDNPATRGQLLWSKTYDPAPNNYTIMLAWYPIDPINHVWTMTYADTGQRLGFSMLDGSQLWGPVGIPDSDINGAGLQYYSSREGSAAYGNLYVSGYGGQVICYSMLNGTTLWTFNSINSGTESPWGKYPIHVGAFADGMVFAFSGEHSPNTPLYKGYRLYAINATTGAQVWNLLDWSASGLGTSLANTAIADGYMVFLNGYDEQVYNIGKGPSAMTVSAPDISAPLATSVTIKGTVMDISPGTKQEEQAARFPNGVPAVSDASQTDWMQYVYEQQPLSTNTTGVPVTLSVVDANGNFRQIGTTTSNNGFFTLNWKPDITGQYTVYASFAGSESYYPSNAMTSFSVDPAAATPAPTAAPIQSVADTYLLPGIIAIIVAIVLVGAVLALLVVKKRP